MQVERFAERVAMRHGLPEERMEKDVKEKLFAIFPRFVHLQPVTLEGCALAAMHLIHPTAIGTSCSCARAVV